MEERKYKDLMDKFRKVTDGRKWKNEAKDILEKTSISSEFANAFHTTWIVQGHYIRSQINNDEHLIKVLRHILPKYQGNDLILYRGENIKRWEEGSIGLSWTSSQEIARMFGNGLNSVPHGGVLLSCQCKAEWIISEPNEHSKYLGENEFTVDPLMLENIKAIRKFKASY